MSLDFIQRGYTGTLLAAMPAIQDATFGGSLVLICAHSRDGAMGLVVNRIATSGQVPERQTDIIRMLANQRPIHAGGPAETDRPFVLHSPDWQDGEETLVIDEAHSMTATPRALASIATGEGPERALIALGYSAWGAGQLENEVLSNVWLTMPADPEIVFAADTAQKWGAAVRSMGAPPEGLSGLTGRA